MLLAGGIGVWVACNGATAPVAGVLEVKLATPNNGQDGAALLVLTAPVAPTSVTAGPGLTLWGGPVATTTARLALTGTISAGTILTLRVEDVNKVRQYGVTLLQIADVNSRLRTSLAGYNATVTR